MMGCREGFAELEKDGHIDCFYTHHKFQSCGIGSKLMFALEQHAVKQQINKLYAEVSTTAKPFFEKKGFQVIKKQIVTVREVKFVNFSMEKSI